MTPNDLVVTRRGVRFLGRYFPASIGRAGITTNKIEGDHATPAGVHHIAGCLFRPDRIRRPNRWATPIKPNDVWSDDTNDPAYNTLARAPHPFSHEMLRRADRLYDLVILTDWNWPDAIAHRGSAIFMHRWRKPGHPTEGCIAFAKNDLHWIVERIGPATRIIVR